VRRPLGLVFKLISRATHAGTCGSPPWIMKSGITRWKIVPS
jgi:hypothetical protein